MMNHRYGTFCAEPSAEEAWDDMGMTPEEQFDVLFGYAEERHIENQQYDYADGYER